MITNVFRPWHNISLRRKTANTKRNTPKKETTPKTKNIKNSAPKHQTIKLPNVMSLHNDTKAGGKI